ncbi:hypothetical protein ACTG16_21800 [Aeromonas sp. 23P]|uniref:hypothetical protein n=1 Tax=Aeromonas sp. 23P TaxID=3452716 RepID=UPI003F7A2782
MKKLILITTLVTSLSVAAEVLSDPTSVPNENQPRTEEMTGVTSSPIKAPGSLAGSPTPASGADMGSNDDASPVTASEMEAPTPLPLPSLSDSGGQIASLQVIMIPDTKTKDAVKVGSIDVNGDNEIRKESTSPIFSLKLSVVGSEKNQAYVSINLSQKGMKKIGKNEYVTNYFMRDIIKVRLDKPSQFNIGESAILFAPFQQ